MSDNFENNVSQINDESKKCSKCGKRACAKCVGAGIGIVVVIVLVIILAVKFI